MMRLWRNQTLHCDSCGTVMTYDVLPRGKLPEVIYGWCPNSYDCERYKIMLKIPADYVEAKQLEE